MGCRWEFGQAFIESRRIVESGKSQRGAQKAGSDGAGDETECKVDRRAFRAPLRRFLRSAVAGGRRGERFHPGRPKNEEVAERGAPPAAVGTVALLEDSSESSGRASEPIRAKSLQVSAPSETVIVDASGMWAIRLEPPSGDQKPGELKSGYSGTPTYLALFFRRKGERRGWIGARFEFRGRVGSG